MKTQLHTVAVGVFLLALSPLFGADDAGAQVKRTDPVNVAQILTGFAAKETCSCKYVVKQSDAYCQAFGQQPGLPVTITFDAATQTATAVFATAGVTPTTRTASAKPGVGCVLAGL